MVGAIIDGRARAAVLQQQIAVEIAALKGSVVPGLAVIQIGDDPASRLYIANKRKACEAIGIYFSAYHFPVLTPSGVVRNCIDVLNKDPQIHGILIQLPLPPSYPIQETIDWIDPEKDVDGLTTENVGRLWNNQANFIPCTPQGCIDLLKTQFSSLQGKVATVLGRSAIVGRPLSFLLLRENVTVCLAHSQTLHPEILCKHSDIIIAAVGKPHLVQASWIKKDAVIIDVGINKIEGTKNKIQGDVDFKAVIEHCRAISPVPGGVGPMTITYLLKNVLKAAKLQVCKTIKV